jgi:pyruvate dehydrogenase E2 component (dihydrolipoamide acetyltransferase)
MGEFRMPSLGADMADGTLLEWLVEPGAFVHRGDVVAVVDTDKAAIEVEVFEDGIVDELLVAPGTRVPVGTPLARLAVPAGAEPSRHVRASPLARRRAAELGVELSALAGSGPDGVVTVGDVVHAPSAASSDAVASPAQHDPASVTHQAAVPPSRAEAGDRTAAMRRATAALMARSKREIPHYYLSTTIDMTAVTTWLRDVNAARPVDARLVPAALLLKAAAVATRATPDLNGFWVDDHLEVSDRVHLGVAVSLRPSGLVAPAILDADTLDVDTLMQRLKDLVTRARAGRLRQQEMASPTITVTNLGDNGVEAVYGVIYPPQVALVGFGRVGDRAVARDRMLGVRACVTATLAGDHRASDGHRGARYLTALDELLQKPEAL